METEFTDAVASWHDFYAAIAGAAATLLGLHFVALAFNPSVMRDERPAGTRVWSRQTFNSFLAVLGIAFVAMIPDYDWLAMGSSLSVVGIFGIYQVYRDFQVARRDPDPSWRSGATFTRFSTPALAYGILFWSAILAFQSDGAAMNVMFLAVFLLLISAVCNCWDLLKAIGDSLDDA